MKATKICHIVGAGDFGETQIKVLHGDLLIAADGGYAYLNALSIKPDLVIGDLDSLVRRPDHPSVLQFQCEKDDTDMMLAVQEGLNRGYDVFMIYGGLGGRPDHTFANIQTLGFLAERHAKGYLLGKGFVVTALCNDNLQFPAQMQGKISVFCMGSPANGVHISGLKYVLDGASLISTVPIGISNEFIGQISNIEVKDGILIVMWQDAPFQLAYRLRHKNAEKMA